MGSASFPSLVFSSEPEREEWNLYDVVDKTNRVKRLCMGGGTDLLMSSPEEGGWVLLRDRGSEELFLFNLATSQRIPVPPLDDDGYEFTFSMPYPPSHPNSSSVAVHTSKPYWLKCCPDSESEFSRHDFPDEEFCPSSATAGYQGKVYVYGDYLVVIDPVSATAERHQHVSHPVPQVGSCSMFQQLVASAACGHLYLVDWCHYLHTSVLHSVQVFKLDLPSQAWVRVDGIGGQAFFMGKSCSMACLASGSRSSINGVKGNRIYFTDDTDQDRLCYYDLDYGSLSVHFPCPENDATVTFPRWVLLDEQQCEASDDHMVANPLALDLILSGKLVTDCSDIMGAPTTPCLLFPHKNDGVYNLVDLFNLFTRVDVQLPTIAKSSSVLYGLALSSPPTSSDCMVFGIHELYDEGSTSILFYRLRDADWSRMSFPNEDSTSPFSPAHNNPVFHNGLFYCLSRNGVVGVFNPCKLTWSVLNNTQLDEQFSTFQVNQCYLLEWEGKLLFVFMDEYDYPRWIFQLRDGVEGWEESSDFGDGLLFLGRYKSIMASSPNEVMKNSICLPKFDEEYDYEPVTIDPWIQYDPCDVLSYQSTEYTLSSSWIELP